MQQPFTPDVVGRPDEVKTAEQNLRGVPQRLPDHSVVMRPVAAGVIAVGAYEYRGTLFGRG
jgi:hypothetical protein